MVTRRSWLLGAVLLVLPACGATSSVDADYATFSSVEELGNTADLVVVGTVEKSLGTEIDGGGDPENGDESSGLWMEFFSIRVDVVVKGDSSTPIVVAWPDTKKADVEGATPVRLGSDLLLFLRSRDQKSAPGIESFDHFYVPVSGDMGVFDVAGDVATARSEEVQSVAAGADRRTGPRLEVPLDRVVAVFKRPDGSGGG